MSKVGKLLPGLLLSVAIAVLSFFISRLTSQLLADLIEWIFNFSITKNLVEPTILALIIGILSNRLLLRFGFLKPGVKFTSKYVLRAAIVVIGSTLSFRQVLSVGSVSLIVMAFTLTTAFVGGNLIARAAGVEWKLAALLSAGTGICGGSAIGAVAPVIEADDSDVSFALTSTYFFDVAMVIIFPLIGQLLLMSDQAFGIWAGTSVNDTSSVVATSFAFSEAAGNVAVIVKLTRTLAIIPAVLIFSYISARKKVKLQNKVISGGEKQKRVQVNWLKVFPMFIVLFLIMALIKSSGIIPDTWNTPLSSGSRSLMLVALAAIGLGTNRKDIALRGKKPLAFAIGLNVLVVVVAFVGQIIVG